MAGALNRQLCTAAEAGDAAGVCEALALGADVETEEYLLFMTPLHSLTTVLHAASAKGHAECVAALLEGGADPNRRDSSERKPLQLAISQSRCAGGGGHEAVVAALLAAGADTGGDFSTKYYTAAHFAAAADNAPILRQLLAADPSLALKRDWPAGWWGANRGDTPLGVALGRQRPAPARAAARCLLEEAPLPPTDEVLAILAAAAARWRSVSSLYAPLVARQPLTAAQWALVPPAYADLGAALPAALARSTAEARLLVQHMAPADRERMRAVALCWARLQRRHGQALPLPVLHQMLLAAL